MFVQVVELNSALILLILNWVSFFISSLQVNCCCRVFGIGSNGKFGHQLLKLGLNDCPWCFIVLLADLGFSFCDCFSLFQLPLSLLKTAQGHPMVTISYTLFFFLFLFSLIVMQVYLQCCCFTGHFAIISLCGEFNYGCVCGVLFRCFLVDWCFQKKCCSHSQICCFCRVLFLFFLIGEYPRAQGCELLSVLRLVFMHYQCESSF